MLLFANTASAEGNYSSQTLLYPPALSCLPRLRSSVLLPAAPQSVWANVGGSSTWEDLWEEKLFFTGWSALLGVIIKKWPDWSTRPVVGPVQGVLVRLPNGSSSRDRSRFSSHPGKWDVDQHLRRNVWSGLSCLCVLAIAPMENLESASGSRTSESFNDLMTADRRERWHAR